MISHKKYLIPIIGPTAIGKTAHAIALAQHFSSEIISADSRQFYKEMSIGTAVPNDDELQAAPHHFIHHISIEDTYSVGDYEKEAVKKINHLFKTHDVLFLVGGSGLYIDAVTKGLDDFPKTDTAVRAQLNEHLKHKGLEHLQEQLKELDPNYYEKVDIHNPHRVIRALEVCLQTGQPFSSFLGKKKNDLSFEVIQLGFTADRSVIYDRINQRVDIMTQNGLLDEAKALYSKKHLNALQTVGYRELFAHFDNEMTLEGAVAEIKKNTRRYAKRQLTWFQKDESIHWFQHNVSTKKVIDFIVKKMSQS